MKIRVAIFYDFASKVLLSKKYFKNERCNSLKEQVLVLNDKIQIFIKYFKKERFNDVGESFSFE